MLGANALLELAERGSTGGVKALQLDSGLEFHLASVAEPRGSLVIAGGSTYSPLELAAGACAGAWRRLAKVERLEVIFIDLPLVAKGEKPSMLMRLKEIYEERPEKELHLVAFGDAAGFIPSMRARHPELPLASVTLVSDSVRRGGRDPRLDVKTLLVECSGSSTERQWNLEEDYASVLIREPFALAGLLVPELIQSWIRAQ